MKPLITGFSIALGIDRSTLYRLINGGTSGGRLGVTTKSIESLKKNMAVVEGSYEDVLINAKSGQVGQIFAMKNTGWRDTVKVAPAARNACPSRLTEGNPEEIAAKYLAMVGLPQEFPFPSVEVAEYEELA